jgi:hypothetical protein
MIQLLTEEELLLMDEQRKGFLETESTPGEDPVNTAEMTIKDLEYYINLVDMAAAVSERIDSNSERSSRVGKLLSNSIACYKKSFVKGSVNRFGNLHCCLLLRTCHSHPNVQQSPP